MKKIVLLGLSLILLISAGGCGNDADVLKVGASAVPHAEILEFAKPLLAEQGIEMEIVVYDDFIQPNLNLSDGEIDANFFQHRPFLDSFNAEYGRELVGLVAVHIEPMGIYSQQFDNLDEIFPGCKVLIPSDPVNEGRSLALLERAGLIKLKAGVGISATLNDIVEDPYSLDIKELDAAFIVNALPDAGLAVINTNFAIQAGLIPVQDALYLEDGQSCYANLLVVNKEDQDEEKLLALAQILKSEAVAQFIEDTYAGQITPAN